MTESQIIWKYLIRVYTNDHQLIKNFVTKGNTYKPFVVNKILDELNYIFVGGIDKYIIIATIKGFLDFKKKEYTNHLT